MGDVSGGIRGRIIAGLIVIIIGVLFLIGNFYPQFNVGRFLGMFWPLILIIIGFLIIYNQARVKRHYSIGDSTVNHGSIVGDVRIDFIGKDIGDSDISQIVGDLVVDLAGGRLKAGINQLNISMVIGDTLIMAPSDMPLKISARTILGDINLEGRAEEGLLPRLEHADESYESSNDKLLITVNGVIGDMALRRT